MCFLVIVLLLVVTTQIHGQDTALCFAKQEILNECPGLVQKYLQFDAGANTVILEGRDGSYDFIDVFGEDNVLSEEKFMEKEPLSVYNLLAFMSAFSY